MVSWDTSCFVQASTERQRLPRSFHTNYCVGNLVRRLSKCSLSVHFFPLRKTKIKPNVSSKAPPRPCPFLSLSSGAKLVVSIEAGTWQRTHRRVSDSRASFVSCSQRSLRRRRRRLSVCLLLVPCAPELIFSGLCSCSIEWVPSFRGSDSWVMGNFRSFLQIFVLLTLGFVGEGVEVINRLG